MRTGGNSVREIYAEGLRYFMGQGSLNNTLTQLATDLKEHNIDYVVIDAVAVLAHGYPRFTEDIDLVMTAEGLTKFHEELVGLGYVPAFPGARKRLRSKDGVSIEVMTTGEYPSFAERLDPYVREKFLELAGAVSESRRKEEHE